MIELAALQTGEISAVREEIIPASVAQAFRLCVFQARPSPQARRLYY
jgi:hypothetical protein